MTLLEEYRRAASGRPTPYVDEAVTGGGADGDLGWRAPYADLARVWGCPEDLLGTAARVHGTRIQDGVAFTVRVDGHLVEQPFPLDVVPRVLTGEDWTCIGEGVAQRTRALEAFISDVYGGGPGHVSSAQAEGVVPDWLVRDSPGYREDAVGWAAPGATRVTVSGMDLLKDGDGPWRVLEDNLRIPSGQGYAIANRAGLAAAEPGLLSGAPDLLDPTGAPALLRAALEALAPRRCPRPEPSVVLLTDGPTNTAWFEHRLLAAAMDAPVVTPADLAADGDGLMARTPFGRVPVDVVYRRLSEDEMVEPTADGTPVGDLLRRAVAAGRVAVANAPGNGVGDDKATYAYVPALVRHYLGETPLLHDVPTWVLADPEMYAEVRHRLGELVVKPVDGYGGVGVVFGPELDERGLADLEAEVAAAPHRFVAQQPVSFTTHPTLVDEQLRARHVDLRVFAISGPGVGAVASPAPLTRVALREGSRIVNSSAGGGSKDTWVLTGAPTAAPVGTDGRGQPAREAVAGVRDVSVPEGAETPLPSPSG
ncbi:circularly permuted type 2 ATP-grasp protein [Pseudokineococcus sp. 1T1Z-3]|uniref:circularly permuted type 2 ATP-grasp protein n=1 Tax=Pseudokineococcus sp. 1T1Z-3 TaxID=3132745 RepID=UPI0030B2E44C